MVFNETNPAAGGEGSIAIHGAREHNLKNCSLQIPRGQFVVVTGVSGSGKSTLAFDLLFAEGQRRVLDFHKLFAPQILGGKARAVAEIITPARPPLRPPRHTHAA